MRLWYVTGPAAIAGVVAVIRQMLLLRFNGELLRFYAQLLERDPTLARAFLIAARSLAPFRAGRELEAGLGIASVMNIARPDGAAVNTTEGATSDLQHDRAAS